MARKKDQIKEEDIKKLEKEAKKQVNKDFSTFAHFFIEDKIKLIEDK